jgi:hypothetical protein
MTRRPTAPKARAWLGGKLDELPVVRMYKALSEIAVGRTDCGRPLGGETARQLARNTLIEIGLKWIEPK